MCLAMVLKKIVSRKTAEDVILAVLFFINAGAYFACKDIVSKVSLESASLFPTRIQGGTLASLMPLILLLAFVFLLIPCFLIALYLKSLLFETKQTDPSPSLSRGIFYAVSLLFPWLIIVWHFLPRYI